ncbi:MAG: hypothetical protein GY768_10635, partial [Planctomycetaceae bacterium]|nr:hypothetical protein [Planctomycetaceae bacterium]
STGVRIDPAPASTEIAPVMKEALAAVLIKATATMAKAKRFILDTFIFEKLKTNQIYLNKQ